MTALAEAPTSTVPDQRRWIALAVLLSATFLDLVDVTIVNIAIPSIQSSLGASFGVIQWVTGGYALTFAVGLVTGGRLGDLYGRKRVFMIGVLGFTLASLVCGVATTPEMLVAARLAQGALAALMVPQVLSIINVTFPPAERGKVFGMFGATLGLGSVIGPLLGAVLTETSLFGLGWRTIFLVNLPIGIAALILGARYLSESKAKHAAGLDVGGVILITLALVAVLFPLTRGRELGWPAWTFAVMAAGLVLVVVFVAFERAKQNRGGSPLVELGLFSFRSFAGGIGLQFTYGVVSGIFFLVWTLYLQLGLGWTPLHAGLTGLPFSLAAAVSSGLSVQLLIPRFGRRVLQSGAVLQGLGALAYGYLAVTLGTEITAWQMAIPLALMGVGMGFIIAPVTNAVLSEVPAESSGSASGVLNMTNQVGVALGLGLVSLAFFRVIDAAPPGAAVLPTAFAQSMCWVAGGLAIIFVLVFFLPRNAGAAATDQPAGNP